MFPILLQIGQSPPQLMSCYAACLKAGNEVNHDQAIFNITDQNCSGTKSLVCDKTTICTFPSLNCSQTEQTLRHKFVKITLEETGRMAAKLVHANYHHEELKSRKIANPNYKQGIISPSWCDAISESLSSLLLCSDSDRF